MDGENKGKPYEQMDDLGVALFLETPTCMLDILSEKKQNPNQMNMTGHRV